MIFQQLVHLWMFGPISIGEALTSIKRVGADGIDLSVSLQGEHNSLKVLNKTSTRKILAESGLPVRVVTPLYKTQQLDFSHTSSTVINTVIEFTCGCVDLALETGADRVLVSPSYIGPDHYYHRSYEEDWRNAVVNLRKVAHYAESRGVLLMLEPVNRYMVGLVHTVAEGIQMIQEINSPALCLVPDVFHMNIEECGGTLGGIKEAAGYIGCFHLGDNNRKPPFYGNLDWETIFEVLVKTGFDGPLSHEPIELYYNEYQIGNNMNCKEIFENQLYKSIKYVRQCMEKYDGKET